MDPKEHGKLSQTEGSSFKGQEERQHVENGFHKGNELLQRVQQLEAGTRKVHAVALPHGEVDVSPQPDPGGQAGPLLQPRTNHLLVRAAGCQYVKWSAVGFEGRLFWFVCSFAIDI